MGLGQGVLGSHPQLHGHQRFFPSKWDTAAQEILPGLIPAGLPVLCNYHFAHGPPSSQKASPRATAFSFFLNQETPNRTPALTASLVERPGLVSYQLNVVIRRPSETQPSLSLGGIQATWNRKLRCMRRDMTGRPGVGLFGKWAHDNEQDGNLCLGHLQVPAGD